MSVSTLYVPFKRGLEPIVRPGENIAYWYRGRWNYFTVQNVEPLPNYIVSLGSLDSGSKTSRTKIDVLEVEDNEIVQVRVTPKAPVKLYVYQPQGMPHYQTKNASFYIAGEPIDVAFTEAITASPTTVFSVPSDMEFRMKLIMIQNTGSSGATITIKDGDVERLKISVASGDKETIDLTSMGGAVFMESVVVESDVTDGSVVVNLVGSFEFDGNCGGTNELYVYKDNLIYVEAYNPLPIKLNNVRLSLTGFKYTVSRLSERPTRIVYLGGEPVA